MHSRELSRPIATRCEERTRERRHRVRRSHSGRGWERARLSAACSEDWPSRWTTAAAERARADGRVCVAGCECGVAHPSRRRSSGRCVVARSSGDHSDACCYTRRWLHAAGTAERATGWQRLAACCAHIAHGTRRRTTHALRASRRGAQHATRWRECEWCVGAQVTCMSAWGVRTEAVDGARVHTRTTRVDGGYGGGGKRALSAMRMLQASAWRRCCNERKRPWCRRERHRRAPSGELIDTSACRDAAPVRGGRR